MKIKKFVEVTCNTCSKTFNKELKEYKRKTKIGKTKFYCNLSCAAKDNESLKENALYAKEHPEEIRNKLINSPNFKLKTNDEFSSFRYFINKSRAKERVDKYGDSDLTPEYLKELWEKQRGVCPYTSLNMELCENTQDYHIKGKPNKASLDRIDSSKGYIKGNVEFVCLAVNYAKNGFTKEEMINFFNLVRNGGINVVA